MFCKSTWLWQRWPIVSIVWATQFGEFIIISNSECCVCAQCLWYWYKPMLILNLIPNRRKLAWDVHVWNDSWRINITLHKLSCTWMMMSYVCHVALASNQRDVIITSCHLLSRPLSPHHSHKLFRNNITWTILQCVRVELCDARRDRTECLSLFVRVARRDQCLWLFVWVARRHQY